MKILCFILCFIHFLFTMGRLIFYAYGKKLAYLIEIKKLRNLTQEINLKNDIFNMNLNI